MAAAAMSTFQPRIIKKSDPTKVVIEWLDGHTTEYTAVQIRSLCPCARCVNELTGERMLDAGTVPGDLTQTDVRLVGNYAITVQFSDGHGTGIYSFRFLRDNDPGG